jgi:hypothetical protein
MSTESPKAPNAVSRRSFLAGVVAPAAVAAAAAPLAAALAAQDAAAAAAKKKTAAPAPAAAETRPLNRPDFSVAKTADERAALEKQWKQMVDLIAGLHKVPVEPGSEFAFGALAMTPRRLRAREG